MSSAGSSARRSFPDGEETYFDGRSEVDVRFKDGRPIDAYADRDAWFLVEVEQGTFAIGGEHARGAAQAARWKPKDGSAFVHTSDPGAVLAWLERNGFTT